MAILFSDDLVVVEQKFFGGWKITNRMTGLKAKPSARAVEQIGLVWIKVRKSPSVSSDLSRLAEEYMFRAFAFSAIAPDMPESRRFLESDPTLLAAHFLDAAKGHAARYAQAQAAGRVLYASERFQLRSLPNDTGMVVDDFGKKNTVICTPELQAKMADILRSMDFMRVADVEKGLLVQKVFQLCCLAASGNWKAASIMNVDGLTIALDLRRGDHDALLSAGETFMG